jgi:hypothetical protein
LRIGHAESEFMMRFWKVCPVCRTSLPWLKTFFRPAWARWECAHCGSIIGIDTRRRTIAIGAWLAVLFAWILWMRKAGIPMPVVLIGLLALCYITITFIDRVIPIEIRGVRCRGCGYDLRQCRDAQCPECGTVIDDEIQTRIQTGDHDRPLTVPHAPRQRWLLILLIVVGSASLLAAGVLLGIRMGVF